MRQKKFLLTKAAITECEKQLIEY